MPLVNDNVNWAEMSEVTSSTLSGFNMREIVLQNLAKWDPRYVYGTTPEEFLNEWVGEGWRHLEITHFGEKSLKAFNESSALRYNILPLSDSRLRWRRVFIMYMDRARYENLQVFRDKKADERLKGQMAEIEAGPGKDVKKVHPNLSADASLTVEELPGDQLDRI